MPIDIKLNSDTLHTYTDIRTLLLEQAKKIERVFNNLKEDQAECVEEVSVDWLAPHSKEGAEVAIKVGGTYRGRYNFLWYRYPLHYLFMSEEALRHEKEQKELAHAL